MLIRDFGVLQKEQRWWYDISMSQLNSSFRWYFKINHELHAWDSSLFEGSAIQNRIGPHLFKSTQISSFDDLQLSYFIIISRIKNHYQYFDKENLSINNQPTGIKICSKDENPDELWWKTNLDHWWKSK